jgi:predicted AAA+ superfamily ATPase
VVLTGARQSGKTTLARRVYPHLSYQNLDAIEAREAMRAIHTGAWGRTVGDAIIDEAQKEPSVFDKVKFAYDEKEIGFSVLLGSSRFLMMSGARESLAGRALVYNLWPLMPVELRTEEGQPLVPPLLDAIISTDDLDDLLGSQPQRLLGEQAVTHRLSLDHVAAWGGMPELTTLDDDDRKEWLRSYQQTFLERDLSDNYADLARDAHISPATARRYLEYLRISYQAIVLEPYSRNLTSTVVKSPKLFWSDLGTMRHGTGQWGGMSGPMFETLVVTEIHKWIDTSAREANLTFYRTRSGMEVDLLVETPHGIIGVEIKNRSTAAPGDVRALVALARALPEWLGGLVVYDGPDLVPLVGDRSIWAMPVTTLL